MTRQFFRWNLIRGYALGRRSIPWAGFMALSLSMALLGCGAPSALSSDEVTPPASTEMPTHAGQSLPITAEVEIAGQVVQLEVTRTREEQSMGLMHRPSLDANRGMLFEFPRAFPVQFWMKNVLIPLDMVFLRDGEVQAIVTAPPCDRDPCPTYGPGTPVDTVIELRGGRAEELGLEAGDRLEIRFLDDPQS